MQRSVSQVGNKTRENHAQVRHPTPITALPDVPAARIRFIAADRADTTVEGLNIHATTDHGDIVAHSL